MQKRFLLMALLALGPNLANAVNLGGPTLHHATDLAFDLSFLPLDLSRATTARFNGRYKEVLPVIEEDIILYRMNGQVSNLLKMVLQDIATAENVDVESLYLALQK